MIKVYQTTFGEGEGNCLQACIASILELRLDQVPHFAKMYGDNWLSEFAEWLRHLCLSAITIKGFEPKTSTDLLNSSSLEDCYVIVGGEGWSEGVGHSVVYKGGEMVHDPVGKEGRGVKEPEDITIIFHLDPAKVINQWQFGV